MQRTIDVPAQDDGRSIVKETVVRASIDRAWNCLATAEGWKDFFGVDARIELRVGGPYEIIFMPDDPVGFQGAEGCVVLCYMPARLLAFTWNAPPEYPQVRGQRTYVVVEFSEEEDGTHIRLTQRGWGSGDEWDEVYTYFDRAWGAVLERLRQHLE